MIEVFDRDGCLTDDALLALIRQEPDEMTRLEIAEHLSFCDRCTERYSELLCEAPLRAPAEPLADSVMEALARRVRVLFFHRYIAAGMAACLALTFWFTGVFEPKAEPGRNYGAVYAISEQITSKSQEFGWKFADRFQSFFDRLSSLDLKGVFQDEKK